MCGIVGAISHTVSVVPLLVEGVSRLEYRGYDSAGIAVLNRNIIETRKVTGRVENLTALLRNQPLSSHIGIAHTRWATHGQPSIANAHPLFNDKVAVVHNGIIENHTQLKEKLSKIGVQCSTQTDSEVIPHLLKHFLEQGLPPLQAFQKMIASLEGSFAIVALFADHHNILIAAKRNLPLVLGYSLSFVSIASALAALNSDEVMQLENNDIAVISFNKTEIYNDGALVHRPRRIYSLNQQKCSKEGFSYYMLKEIYEQPQTLAQAIEQFDNKEQQVQWKEIGDILLKQEIIRIIGCGSSYFAGLIAKYLLQELLGVTINVEIASEFRYNPPPLHAGEFAIFLSQSGETADTLEALQIVKSVGQRTIAIVNAEGSTMESSADFVIKTRAGEEVGVAATKSFTSQLIILLGLCIFATKGDRLKALLQSVPMHVNQVLRMQEKIMQAAQEITRVESAIYIGRGTSYGVAMEGALKMKELSYIHAEGVAAGELKHGSIALIAPDMITIAIAPCDRLFPKMLSNIEEIKARNGRVVVVTDHLGESFFKDLADHIISIPHVDHLISPILYSVVTQLLAYYTALARNNDIDRPRNLAKSVTVE